MPVNPDGSLRNFTDPEIAAMKIRTFDVRNGAHPIHTREVDQNTMARTFLVNWAQKENFVEHVCGRSALYTAAGITKLSRLLPDIKVGRSQVTPPDMVATRITDMRGLGAGIDDAFGVPAYSDAQVSVFYEQPTYLLKSDAAGVAESGRFVSPSVTSQGTLETVGPFPGGCFKYTTPTGVAPHGVPVPTNVSFINPIERFFVTWHGCPWNLYSSSGALYTRLKVGEKDAITGQPDGIPLEGTVNRFDLNLSGIGRVYAAGRLLLERVEPVLCRRQIALAGIDGLMYDFKFHFAYRAKGWLSLYLFDPAAPANSGYYVVSNDGVNYIPETIPDKVGIYNCRDHSKLFDPNY